MELYKDSDTYRFENKGEKFQEILLVKYIKRRYYYEK